MNKKEILSFLEIKKILIIVGGDKTEKASEIPKLFLNDNTTNKTIVCTEAKRSNAIKLAELVSKQMNEQVGKTIGYCIRFEEKVSNESKIKFITDGLLVREMMVDPLLNNYSIIIIDQVDERSLSTDLLLALLKKLEISTTKRPDLKIVILTSTNSNANEIKNFFGSDYVSTHSFGNEDSSTKTTTTTTPEIENFEMITSPSLESINQSLNELFRLGAISSNKDNESSKLTSIGKTMVGLPLEPIYSKVIIESEKLGCSEQILNIVSMLLINNKNDLFIDSKLSSSSALIDSQISIKLLSCNDDDDQSSKQSTDHIKKSFLSGFFNNVAKSTTDTSYETIVEPIRKVLLHPTSSVVPESNQFVLFGETIKIDKREYIKDVSVIDQSWLH
ncbi:hypothetical protein ACTFIY_011267 [Dictyostelium cf. discoideum]